MSHRTTQPLTRLQLYGLDETSATSLRLLGMKAYKTRQTLLDITLTVTLISTLRPTSTPSQLRQRLYRTSEAPLKLSRVYNNDYFNTMSRTKTNWRSDREKYTRTNAATAMLLKLVKPAETFAANTNERREMVTSTITLLSTT